MKFISWNVNGLRAIVQKGDFTDFFNKIDADFFCLQETKLQEGQIELDLPGYHQYWNYAVKKGYSGTAIFTKQSLAFSHLKRVSMCGTHLPKSYDSLNEPIRFANSVCSR